MGIKGYKIKSGQHAETLIGTQPRSVLNKLRNKGYKVRKIKK